MKRIASVFLTITLIVGLASTGFAQDPTAKLTRGAVNALTGLLEVPATVLKMCKNEGAPKGLSTGLLTGLVMGVRRTVVGLYEVLTFAIPVPAGYKAMTDPETLLTSETLQMEDPSMRSDFRPLGAEISGGK